MKTAFWIYGVLLLLEGLLAWFLTGQAFLPVAAGMGLIVFNAVRQTSRAVAEGVRLLTAGGIAIAGPIQYQASLIPLFLCFIAVPHFLAATQALLEQRQDASTHGNPTTRSLVFTIAFYVALGLAILLARGLEPALPQVSTSLLAVGVLLLAAASWQASRITRLPSGRSDDPPSLRRWVLPATLLGILALIYGGLLPPVAEVLCRISPRWRMDPIEFTNKPPKPPPTKLEAQPANEAATRTGVDEFPITGGHRLPSQSDLKFDDQPRFFVKMDQPAGAATLLAQGPVYLRSHTLNKFSNSRWSPEVSGGVWREDAADGKADNTVTLSENTAALPEVKYEVFANAADGYTLPAIPGLLEIELPRVYAIRGDILQSPASGNIRYRGISAPSVHQNLPNQNFLQTEKPDSLIHLKPGDGPLGDQLQVIAKSIFKDETALANRIAALRAFFEANYTYSTVMKNPPDKDPLANFLADERRGHCDFFASAASLILRQAGVPTRMAYGYASREAGAEDGLIIFRDRHAHAWTEIFLKKYGWTICDFTPGENVGQGTPPDQPPPPQPKLEPSAFAEAARKPDPVAEKKVEANLPSFANFLTWAQQQAWVVPILRYAPWLLLGFAVLLGVVRLLLKKDPAREAAAAARARAALDRQPAYFLEFLRLSAAAGHPKPDGRTPWEHYRSLHQAGLPVPPLQPLIEYHCATRYEDAPPNPKQETAFSDDLKTFASLVLRT